MLQTSHTYIDVANFHDVESRPAPHDLASARARRARCTASDLLRWSGLGGLADEATDALCYSLRQVPMLSTLIVEGQPLHHLYVVVAGSFKSTRTDDEGYEQVLGFALQGEMLGLDALSTQRHACGVVALEDSAVAALPLTDLLPHSSRLHAMEQLLWHAAGVELRNRAETQYQMSAPSTEVRLARFLLHLAQQQLALGHSGRQLNLRMSRRDIASCLGVAHESVSRALATLVQAGCITVNMREIEIVDPTAMHALQRVTRGAPRSRELRHAQAHMLAA